MENQKQEVINKESNKFLIVSLVIIAVFVAGLLTNGFGLTKLFFKPVSDLAIGDSPVLGDPNAPVIIYEFTDFSCPFCAAADGDNPDAIALLKQNDPTWQAPLPLIRQNYVNTGKAKIVFKYFPGHGTGRAAQEVGWALNDQGLFWKFYDAAFANQADTGDLTKMKTLAQSIGANITQLDEVLNSNKYTNQFTLDGQMGTSAGVKGTPTFFINGKKIEGAQSYPEFKKAIDAELAKSS